jgi:hypothetical protein
MHRRIELTDRCETTVHVATFPPAGLRLVRLMPETPVEEWCAREGVTDAVSGGYSVKPEYEPLGELWVDGRAQSHRAFAEPWHRRRAALAVIDGGIEIDYRDRLPVRVDGGMMQAGPLLVLDGCSAIAGVEDPEGFSATAEEFDQDLTASREPRLAIGLTADGSVIAVAADGPRASGCRDDAVGDGRPPGGVGRAACAQPRRRLRRRDRRGRPPAQHAAHRRGRGHAGLLAERHRDRVRAALTQSSRPWRWATDAASVRERPCAPVPMTTG